MMTHKKSVKETKMAAPVFRPEVFRRNRAFAISLWVIFAVIYFGAALLTSAPLKEIAALLIFGLPLGIWVGWLVFASGLVIVRIYLTRAGKS